MSDFRYKLLSFAIAFCGISFGVWQGSWYAGFFMFALLFCTLILFIEYTELEGK
jgi:hypothetical protein